MVIQSLSVSGVSPLGDNVRTCPWADGYDPTRPINSKESVSSVREIFCRSVEEHSDHPCLGWRLSENAPYRWWTYQDLSNHVTSCLAGLRSLGLRKGDCIGIYARNCPQWIMIQYAAISFGLVIVPIYDTLGPNIVEYVCNHAQVKVVFVSHSNFSKIEGVLEGDKIPTVSSVIVIGHSDICQQDEIDLCASARSSVTGIADFMSKGKDLAESASQNDVELCLDDELVIMYTSGTTGNPKGVVLTHRNFVASISSTNMFFSKWSTPFKTSDIYLSYLPLAHIFEQQTQAVVLSNGGRIGFYCGNVKLILSDLEALQPTIFVGVPRVYARFQQRIVESVDASSRIKKWLFDLAYSRQLQAEQAPNTIHRSGIWDSLVMNKVRNRLLPKAKIAITGSAPMSAQTNDYLKVCLNCPVVQGYGLTETVGGMTCSAPGRSLSGTVGGPFPGVHVKLRDLPEMDYLTSDKPFPRGEICVKGDVVFERYYKNTEATAAVFDADGFFKTGDVGQWLADGSLQIIDRAKNLFKLSQGEYISPEALELEYSKCRLVGQIFVYGNSLRSTLVAVVIPDVESTKVWGGQHGESSLESIVQLDSFKKDVLNELEQMRQQCKIKKYEAVEDVIIDVSDINDLGQGFHIENDLLTPSFKLKRPQLKRKYGDRLDALYRD